MPAKCRPHINSFLTCTHISLFNTSGLRPFQKTTTSVSSLGPAFMTLLSCVLAVLLILRWRSSICWQELLLRFYHIPTVTSDTFKNTTLIIRVTMAAINQHKPKLNLSFCLYIDIFLCFPGENWQKFIPDWSSPMWELTIEQQRNLPGRRIKPGRVRPWSGPGWDGCSAWFSF